VCGLFVLMGGTRQVAGMVGRDELSNAGEVGGD